jgi:hypothetical protein
LKRDLSMPLYLEWVQQIPIWISQSDDLQLMKHKIVLSKSTLMNHHHWNI